MSACIDDFIDARKAHIHPAWMLCVHESVSSCCRRDAATLGAMPHVTRIPRNPRRVGLQMKDTCDLMTGIMLRLELL